MFHAFDVVTNTKGDSLVGYQVLVRDPTTSAIIPIYADDNGTPIGSVSNLINIALTDSAGNYSFFVPFGTYNLEFRTPDGVSVRTINSVPFNSGSQGAPGKDGEPGASDNTYADKPGIAASDPSRIVASLKQTSTQPGTRYYWTLGDFTGRTDVIVSTFGSGTPISQGAWVPQPASGIAYQARGTNAVPTSVDTVLKDAPPSAAAFASLAAAVQNPLGLRLKDGVHPTAESLSPVSGVTLAGAGRERTFERVSGSGSAYFSTANFITHIDKTIDRASGIDGIGISHRSPNNETGPLEGFKVLRCNINGHTYGVDVRDAVIASLEESYIQACATGATFSQTGSNASTVIGLRQVWFRGNSVVGLLATTVVNMQLDQTVFESGPKGFSLQACTDVQLNNGWYESLALAGEMVNCRSVAFNGGSIDGKLTGMRVFYAFGSTTACDIEFTGAWRVDNLTAFVATADGNVTITVKTPSLAPYNFQALNGGRVIFDFLLTGKKTWDPPSIPALSTTMTTLPVPGLKVGDICTASFENGTNDPQSIFLNANCLADGTATVVAFNALNVALDLASGTLTILANRRPLIS